MTPFAIFKNFLIATLLSSTCKLYGQELNVSLLKQNVSTDANVYSLKVFNNFSKPIAIKVSGYFMKFSNVDTLPIAIEEWSNTNGRDYYFGIDRSVSDGQGSEPGGYQLFILNPQTYLLTNVILTDFNKYKNRTLWFSLVYSDNLTTKDSVFLNRSTTMYLTRDFNRPFKSANFKLN